jgi:hypothetical protein
MNETFGPEDISFESALDILVAEYGKENVSTSSACFNGPRSIKVQIDGKWQISWSE